VKWDAEDIARAKEILRNPGPDIDRLGPCPDWCKGRPHDFRGDVASEQAHLSDTWHKLYVETKHPAPPVDGGRYWLLGVEIEWAPFANSAEDREIVAMVFIDGGMPVEMTPDQIRALADSLAPQADRLREFADYLAGLRVEEMPDQGDPNKIT
jgi:hypothetical protein